MFLSGINDLDAEKVEIIIGTKQEIDSQIRKILWLIKFVIISTKYFWLSNLVFLIKKKDFLSVI